MKSAKIVNDRYLLFVLTGIKTNINEETPYSSTPKTSAAAAAEPLAGFVFAAVLVTLRRLT